MYHQAVKQPQIEAIDAAIGQLAQYDTIIDVRSPGEFAQDHIPGAVNLPVLSDAQREQVGILNASHGAFEANRVGASLVSANIARLLAGPLADKPRRWRSLVYCWRGGNRSGSLATVIARIGWRTDVLDGGYRAYRRWILQQIPPLSEALQFQVIAGRTGTGKSRILRAIACTGGQVLDLEALANHRGSVLGLMPETEQPSQKRFDSQLWDALRRLRLDQPVYVESESRKIGRIQLPDALITRIRAAACHIVEMPVPLRARYLVQDYPHFVTDPAALTRQIDRLLPLHGAGQLAHWQELRSLNQWQAFVESLLTVHYDPAYDRSMSRNFSQLDAAHKVSLVDGDESFDKLFANAARRIMKFGS